MVKTYGESLMRQIPIKKASAGKSRGKRGIQELYRLQELY